MLLLLFVQPMTDTDMDMNMAVTEAVRDTVNDFVLLFVDDTEKIIS